jgi:hypothetical protein
LPGRAAKIGRKDLTLLNALCSTGARAEEICDLAVGDISFASKGGGRTHVRLMGKGGKQRTAAIPEKCSAMLKRHLETRDIDPEDPASMGIHVFPTQTRNRMSIACVEEIAGKSVLRAKESHPGLFRRDSNTPRFICFYNGTASAPDYVEHRLNGCFKSRVGGMSAELVVRAYSICEERNDGFLSRSRNLRAYSVFVAKTREFIPQNPTPKEKVAGVSKAIGCYIQDSRCPEYFSRRKAEVIDMMVDEITTEQYIELQIRSLKREARKQAEEVHKKDKEAVAGKIAGKGYAPKEIDDLLDIPLVQALKLSAKES